MLKTPPKRRHIENHDLCSSNLSSNGRKGTRSQVKQWFIRVVLDQFCCDTQVRKKTHTWKQHVIFHTFKSSSKMMRLPYKMTWNSIKKSSTSILQHEDRFSSSSYLSNHVPHIYNNESGARVELGAFETPTSRTYFRCQTSLPNRTSSSAASGERV